MKRSILVMAIIGCLSCTMADTASSSRFQGNAALAKEILRIVDENGLPVAGAIIHGGLQTGGGVNDFVPINGITSSNGEYVIEGKCTNRIRCDVKKDGYYRSEFLLTSYGATHSCDDGKWMPYGTVNVITLHRVKRLGTLAVPSGRGSNVGRWRVPKWNSWIGFDFEVFDWVKPYGDGCNQDALFLFTAYEKDPSFDFKFTMDICFTNSPFAGAYVCKKNQYSDLQWPSCADSNETYRTKFSYSFERHPNGERVVNTLPDEACMVFRTRTGVNDAGELVSAHYGVISGEWLLGSETMRFNDACFNPNENDLCIEDGCHLRKQTK